MCLEGRPFNCCLCRRQVVLCRSCDRGHRYCSKSCSEQGRRERRRESNRRHAVSERGRENNRRRQQRHRIRHALPARAGMGSAATACQAPPSVHFVTDHGSATPARRLPGAVRPGESFPRCARCNRPCPLPGARRDAISIQETTKPVIPTPKDSRPVPKKRGLPPKCRRFESPSTNTSGHLRQTLGAGFQPF